MVVVVLLDDGGIVDIVGPFDTTELANKWATEQRDGDVDPVDMQFDNWYVSDP